MKLQEVYRQLNSLLGVDGLEDAITDATVSLNSCVEFYYNFRRFETLYQRITVVNGSYTFPDPAPWMLYSIVPVGGTSSVSYTYSGSVLIVDTDGDYHISYQPVLTLAGINTIPYDLLQLMLGQYKMSIGQALKIGKIDELPISLDGDNLFSEGKELYDSKRQEIMTARDEYED